MGYKLIIAEKPSVGKAIDSWLMNNNINGYKVTWLFGHMLELDEPESYDEKFKSWDVKLLPIIPQKFKLSIKNDAGIKKQVSQVKSLLEGADGIVNAGDPDREGQLLVDELLEFFSNNKPVQRIWLSAIDDKSIAKAFNSLKANEDYVGYKLAARARSQADWLVGMNYSRALSHIFKNAGYSSVSIGRVQTPTLKLIVDRDNAIKNFKQQEFYELFATFNSNKLFDAKLIFPNNLDLKDGLLLDKSPLEQISAKILNKNGVVTDYVSEEKESKPPLLYNLSELQFVANNKYGYSAQYVLSIAQELYENKITSYPRSDCQYMPESQHSEANNILKSLVLRHDFEKLTPNPNFKSSVWNNKKVSAHHAIIPTGANLEELDKLSEKHKNIFKLIAIQYIMQFYPNFKYTQVDISLEIEGYNFKTSGKSITDLGWKSLIIKSNDEDEKDDDGDEGEAILPKLTKGDILNCCKTSILSKHTQKPKQFNEGTLIKTMVNIQKYIPEYVKAMGYDNNKSEQLINEYKSLLKETSGLGTEATRAGIIETLKRRGLINVTKKNISATEVGFILIDTLTKGGMANKELSWLANPITTAEYEQHLDGIQNNVETPQVLISKLSEKLVILKTFPYSEILVKTYDSKYKCSKCGGNLKQLAGKFGKFWKCQDNSCGQNYKDEKGKPNLQAIRTGAPNFTGKLCPNCNKQLVERAGKHGKFVSCSGYPDCKYIKPVKEIHSQKTIQSEHKCPNCSDGFLQERDGKYGKFWGCSSYPKCKTVIKDIANKPNL